MIKSTQSVYAQQLVTYGTKVHEGLKKLDETARGILLLVDADGYLIQTVTDGDIRRLLLAGKTLDDTLEELPPKNPVVTTENTSSEAELLQKMNTNGVNQIVIITDKKKPLSIAYREDVDTSILLSTPHMGEEEQRFVSQAFTTNWIAPVGPHIDSFEKELADKVGVKHAVAVSSGTAALHLALRTLNIGKGDAVFCSSFTFVASANPIIYQGAEPVFIDSEPDTWNMSPQALARALEDAAKNNRLPKAVIVVSLYGQSADMDALRAHCNGYEVPIIEDAAESLGATYKGKASGTLGRLGFYSFNGNKIITTSGGGMLVTNDAALAEHARKLSTQAREPVVWYEHAEIGYNYRISNILAGVGRGQLKVLTERVAARRGVFERYQALLSDIDCIQWMPEAPFGKSTRWLSTLLVKGNVDVSAIVSAMLKEKIEVRPLWKPLHQQPVFAGCPYYPHEPGTSLCDDWFLRGLCLPSGSNLSETQIQRVAEILRPVLMRQG